MPSISNAESMPAQALEIHNAILENENPDSKVRLYTFHEVDSKGDKVWISCDNWDSLYTYSIGYNESKDAYILHDSCDGFRVEITKEDALDLASKMFGYVWTYWTCTNIRDKYVGFYQEQMDMNNI